MFIYIYEGVFFFLSGVGLGERLLKELCCWLNSCDTGLTGSKGCAFIPDIYFYISLLNVNSLSNLRQSQKT